MKNKTVAQLVASMSKTERDEELVSQVQQDFKARQNERKPFEAQWLLNINFLMGNQYCSIANSGEVEDYTKQFFWQEREIYNHIAPIVEVRSAKLARVRPTMAVVPSSASEHDVKTSKLSKKILQSVCNNINLPDLVNKATRWSEVCGTSFYKVVWNASKGKTIGKTEGEQTVQTGDVEVVVCSPFEIYPSSATCETVAECESIIHAKAVHVNQIKSTWGVEVPGEEINVFSLDNISSAGGFGYNSSTFKIASASLNNYAVVVERYEKPSKLYPNGRLTIVVGNHLLHDGELPYQNANNHERTFPFIKQCCLSLPSCFWGTSVIERIIPVQRAYNAVKNRKHEFLNRVSMGILTVEDGSIDIENLEDEGLSPGKVLVYRQGSNPPAMMSNARVPIDFSQEEERLLNEFILVSGVSDVMRGTNRVSDTLSGVALQMLIEQDDTRISITADSIKSGIKEVAKHILRLFKQFALLPRIVKIADDVGDVEVFYFSKSDISSDDVVFETQNEIGETLAQKRNMVFELLKNGLLQDEDGKLSNRMRAKALDLLGFGIWENSQDLSELNIKKAQKEQLQLLQGEPKIMPLEVENHAIHIAEHTAFMLGKEFEKAVAKMPDLTEKMLSHIREHKKMAAIISASATE